MSGVVIAQLLSVGKLVLLFFVAIKFLVVIFGCRWRWRRHTGCGGLPNQSPPFIGLAEKLQCCEGMTRITLDAQYFCDYLQLLSVLALHFQAYATTNVGQLSRQVNQRTFRPHVFRCAF